MSIFEGVGELKYNPDFMPGIYTAKVVSCRKNDKTISGKAQFLMDFEILESSEPMLSVGTKCTWSVMKDPKFPKYFVEGITLVLSGALGKPANAITPEFVEKVTSSQNPLAGLKVRVMAEHKLDGKTGQPKLRKSGSPIVNIRLTPIAE